jgi:hypothetical protein
LTAVNVGGSAACHISMWFEKLFRANACPSFWAASQTGGALAMSELKINEIPDKKIREKRLRTQRDEGRPTEDDIVREHFGPRGEKKDNPNRLPLEANTRRDWLIGW